MWIDDSEAGIDWRKLMVASSYRESVSSILNDVEMVRLTCLGEQLFEER